MRWVAGAMVRGSPLSLSFQIPERSSPSRARCAAPTSRALDVSGPFRTRAQMRERGQMQRHNVLAAAGCDLPLVGIEVCSPTEAIILRKPPRRPCLEWPSHGRAAAGVAEDLRHFLEVIKNPRVPHKPRGPALQIKRHSIAFRRASVIQWLFS